MSKKGKVILVAVLSVAAILVMLWNFDVFASPPKQPPPPTANMTPEQKTEFEKDQQKQREWEKKQPRPASGA